MIIKKDGVIIKTNDDDKESCNSSFFKKNCCSHLDFRYLKCGLFMVGIKLDHSDEPERTYHKRCKPCLDKFGLGGEG